jgi:hypothetical protein
MMIEQGRGDNMQDTVNAIAQLATATASDRGTLATLTATSAKLAYQLEVSQAYIKMLLNYSHSRNPRCAPARTHGQIQAPREPPN